MGEIIYNPILLTTATTAEIKAKRQDWGLPDGAIAVGLLASLHKEKGIWRILQIAKTICPSNPLLHFVLAGDTDSNLGEGPAFARAVAEAGLADRIHLVGYESNLAVAYGAFDIVLCLFGEYLNAVGRTAYEAPLAGKPLIATLPHPDTSTSVLQGVTGLGFECLDFEGVTRAIVDLSQNPGKRQALGESARAAIAERHSLPRHARKVLNVYHRLLSNAGHDDDE
jgi:glycosyltransferase involved in cell wall biosynthesis